MASLRDSDEVLALLEKLRVYLEKHYDIRIVSLNRLDRGVYRVDRQEGQSWVARIFSAKRALQQVQGDAEVLRFLEEHGFPSERCARPDPVSAPGGRGVLVTEYVDGTTPERSEPNLRAMGEMVGRLNTLPIGSGLVAREAGSLHHYSLSGGGPRKELDAAASWLAEVEDKVATSNRASYESLREQVARADDSHGLPEALIHPDPVVKNVIATPDTGLVLIDWTGAGRGPRLASLAVLIWTSALGKDGWSLERVDPVVAGYRSHVQLQKDELERLADVMRVRPLVFACWRYRRAITSEKQPDGKEWWWQSDELVESVTARARAAFERPVEKSS
jgi:Ser/Thr protein kinase RdoA (MazF antagonist)